MQDPPPHFSTELPCMVLCAGTSARFGRDKMLVDLSGKPVVGHILERLRGQTGLLALNAPHNDAYSQFDLPVIEDCLDGKLGPLVGILTAMKWAAENQHTHVLTCAGDTPFIPRDWATRLRAHSGAGIIISQSEGQISNNVQASNRGQTHYVCALWPVDLRLSLENAIRKGMRGVGQWISTQQNTHVIFETPDGHDPFFNINTQEDLMQARAILTAESF